MYTYNFQIPRISSANSLQPEMLSRSGFQPYRPDERLTHPAGPFLESFNPFGSLPGLPPGTQSGFSHKHSASTKMLTLDAGGLLNAGGMQYPEQLFFDPRFQNMYRAGGHLPHAHAHPLYAGFPYSPLYGMLPSGPTSLGMVPGMHMKLEEEHRARLRDEEAQREKERQLREQREQREREREQRETELREKEQREREQREKELREREREQREKELREKEQREREREREREMQEKEREARETRERLHHYSSLYGPMQRNLNLLAPLLPPGLTSTLPLGRLPPTPGMHSIPQMSSYLSAPPRQSPHGPMALNLGLGGLSLPPPRNVGSPALNQLSHHLTHPSVSTSLSLGHSGVPVSMAHSAVSMAMAHSVPTSLSLGHLPPPTSIGLSHSVPSSGLNLSHHSGGLNLSHAPVSTSANSNLSHHTHTHNTPTMATSLNLSHSNSPSEPQSLNLSSSREPTPAHSSSNIPTGPTASMAHYYQSIAQLQQQQSLHLQQQQHAAAVAAAAAAAAAAKSNHVPAIPADDLSSEREHNHVNQKSSRSSPSSGSINLTNPVPAKSPQSTLAFSSAKEGVKSYGASTEPNNVKRVSEISTIPVTVKSSPVVEMNGGSADDKCLAKSSTEKAIVMDEPTHKPILDHSKEDNGNSTTIPISAIDVEHPSGEPKTDSVLTLPSTTITGEAIPMTTTSADPSTVLQPIDSDKSTAKPDVSGNLHLPPHSPLNPHQHINPTPEKAVIMNKEPITINNTSSEDESSTVQGSCVSVATPPPVQLTPAITLTDAIVSAASIDSQTDEVRLIASPLSTTSNTAAPSPGPPGDKISGNGTNPLLATDHVK